MNASDRVADVPHVPFADTLDISIAEVTAEQVTATMAWAEQLCTTGAILHGGALAPPPLSRRPTFSARYVVAL
jgi:acyl-coenzyme A thioesterase PaaI-like protein